MSLRRVLVGSVAALGAAVMLAGAAAFACITPAAVNLSTASGKPGDVVTMTGTSFKMPEGTSTGVQIRWKTPDGPLLAQVIPDVNGSFSATFKIPDGPPGYYVIAAVLKDATGQDVASTPGRALFEVQGAVAPPDTAAPARTFTESSGSSGSSFPIILAVGLGAVGLALFAGGFVAVSRSRRAKSPVTAPVRQD